MGRRASGLVGRWVGAWVDQLDDEKISGRARRRREHCRCAGRSLWVAFEVHGTHLLLHGVES
jgi:hypothetical protein